MFNLKTIALMSLILSNCAFTATLDLKKIESSMIETCSKIKSEKDFAKRFVFIQNLIKEIENETKKVTDSNYQAEQDRLFELNFYQGNLLSLDTPFAKNDCSFQLEKLKTNFSDYKTGEIHPKLKNYAEKIIKIGNCLCE